MPISRSTIAAAASVAMPRTLAIAAVRRRGDRLLGLGDAGVELRIERPCGGLGRGRLLLAGLVGERLRAAARVGQRLLVGRDGGVGLVLEALRLGEIAVDALPARPRGSRRRAAARPATSAGRARRRSARARTAATRRSAASNGGKPLPCSPAGMCSVVPTGCALFCAIADSGSRAAARCRRVIARLTGANSSSSAISSEKMPSASVTAKPKIRLPNWPCAADGIAQRGGEIVAEDRADADAGAAHADAGDAGADHLCGVRIHEKAPFRGSMDRALSGPGGSHR